jgi:hypothetical protein
MNAKEKRMIHWSVDDIAAGYLERGVERLCHLIGREVPELHERPVPKAEPHPRGRGVLRPQPPQTEVVESDALATPMDKWRALHQRCLIDYCTWPSAIDCHHIWSKGLRGPDVDWNRAPLCRHHHNRWHTMTPEPDAFLAHYAAEIPAEWHQKIAAARAMQTASRKGTLQRQGREKVG